MGAAHLAAAAAAQTVDVEDQLRLKVDDAKPPMPRANDGEQPQAGGQQRLPFVHALHSHLGSLPGPYRVAQALPKLSVAYPEATQSR